jgi:energy-coupling factor transporter transmembrane protein EcfT
MADRKKRNSFRIDFWPKVFCFLVFLPLASFLGGELLLAAITLLLFFSVWRSKIGFWRFIKPAAIYIVPITISIFLIYLLISRQSPLDSILANAAILSLRFGLAIASGVFFSLITNPIEFPAGFMQAKIPHRYGVALMVSYRMMPLISAKISAIVDAQRGRGASFRFDVSRPFDFFYRMNSLIIPVLYNTLSMSVRLSDALIARGYNPYGKITYPPRQFTRTDFFISLFSLLIFIFSIIKIQI